MVFSKITKPSPITATTLVFTDDSSNGTAVFSINGKITKFHTEHKAAQLVELTAFIQVFQILQDLFILYTDSSYVAVAVPLLETVQYIKPDTNDSPLFSHVQQLILARFHPFFISHIRAHSSYLDLWQRVIVLLIKLHSFFQP